MVIFATFLRVELGLWCNGNTTDSGPVILGSSPGSPTQKKGMSIGTFPFLLPCPECRDRGFLELFLQFGP